MASEGDTLQQLKQAIEHHRQALEALQEALLAELNSCRQEENGHHRREVLSIKEACEELGMGKSWVYHRLRACANRERSLVKRARIARSFGELSKLPCEGANPCPHSKHTSSSPSGNSSPRYCPKES